MTWTVASAKTTCATSRWRLHNRAMMEDGQPDEDCDMSAVVVWVRDGHMGQIVHGHAEAGPVIPSMRWRTTVGRWVAK